MVRWLIWGDGRLYYSENWLSVPLTYKLLISYFWIDDDDDYYMDDDYEEEDDDDDYDDGDDYDNGKLPKKRGFLR